MLLSVIMPHSGREEMVYMEALESVRVTLREGKSIGTIDFFIGGGLNIELKLGLVDDEHRDLDCLD